MAVEDLTIPSGGDNTWQEWMGNSGQLRSLLQNQASTVSLLLLASDLNVRYVDKGGNDTTGDGSRVKPFLTVQKAITVCAALATFANPFLVRVSPGTYATTFKLSANVYVCGSGSAAGSYNGTPQSGVTLLATNATNSIDASFAGATVQATGLLNCALSGAFKADFAAVASTAASSILIDNVQTDSAMTFVGSGNLEYAVLQSLYFNTAANLTFTDMGGSLSLNCCNDFNGIVVYNQAAAIQGFHQQVGCLFAALQTNWTSALITNFLLIQMFTPFNSLNNGTSLISGAGSIVVAPGATASYVMSDAANRLSFGNVAAATIIGVNCGRNIIRCTPTVARVLTIDRPNTNSGSTEILLQNLGAVPIDLTFSAGGSGVATGSPTYVPPLSQLRIIFDFALGTTSLWMVEPIVQSGTVVLVNGVSAAIKADVTANSRIVVDAKTFNGAAGEGVVLAADRTVGTRAGAGQILVKSIAPGTGLVVGSDQGTYDWMIVNQGG